MEQKNEKMKAHKEKNAYEIEIAYIHDERNKVWSQMAVALHESNHMFMRHASVGSDGIRNESYIVKFSCIKLSENRHLDGS